MYLRRRCLILFVLLVAPLQNAARGESPSLLETLTSEGIALTETTSVVIPSPRLHVSQDDASRAEALDRIAGGIGWKRFSRNSHVAPIEIDMEYVKDDAGQRVGHLVYVAFVAYCEIDQLRDQSAMERTFGSAKDEPKADEYDAKELTIEQLAEWGFAREPLDAKYAAIRMPLLDRVLVHGVIASQYRDTDDQLTVGWMIDPRFTMDETSRPSNHWKRVEGDETSHPYQGAGGYLCVTRLAEPAGACLLECSMVLHEPADWFRGSNLLRSKLPLLIQESVRKFRRQLSEAESSSE